MLLQESDEDASESQENQSGGSTTGRVPRSMTCFLDRDLVDCCVPGDFVHICGIVSLLPAANETSGFGSSNGWRRPQESAGSSRGNLFNLCLRVNSVTRIFCRSGEDGGGGGGGSKVVQCLTSRRQAQQKIGNIDPSEMADLKTADTHFSLSDLYAIRRVAEEGEDANLFNLLLASFCPAICGRELVKMAILLALFGGSADTASLQLKPSHSHRETSPDLTGSDSDSETITQQIHSLAGNDEAAIRRSSSHVLFVGK